MFSLVHGSDLLFGEKSFKNLKAWQKSDDLDLTNQFSIYQLVGKAKPKIIREH